MAQNDLDSSLAATQFRPRQRLEFLLRPIHRFMEMEASGGIVLLLATIAALLMANTSLSNEYGEFWQRRVAVSFGGTVFETSVLRVINDWLMTIFFFLLGLEIKRCLVMGDLRPTRAALLPMFAAIGGMLAPALLYLAIEGKGPAAQGWAVPMATDIAFVIGFLSLLGKRVPVPLKLTIITMAIANDIGAIIVVAGFKAKGLHGEYAAAALGFYGLVFIMNFLGVRRTLPYVLIGFAMWVCLLRSGIQPTIAGVLLALAAPGKRLISNAPLKDFLGRFQRRLDEEGELLNRSSLRVVGREANSPLERLEFDLHPWVAFGILPLFALANIGVAVQLTALESTTVWAIILCLVVGKPIGIFCLSWLAHALRWAYLPAGVTLPIFFAASCLGGIGFTMSIFLAGMTLNGATLVAAKIGILFGSALSAGLGLILLHRFLDRRDIASSRPE